ncbi:MAG: NAD-dependent malic enzyme [Gemmatimonadota bacterium]|nr:NAD-dependent malic enzyme [Gemmatimonadota bacterium]
MTESARDTRSAKVDPRGVDLLHDPLLNKGTAFTERERDALDLRGLLPPRVFTIEEQKSRILENFERKPTDLEKYVFMIALEDRNETLFYRTVVDEIETMMPILYTPTVGEACRSFGHVFRRARGLYVSAEDRGRVAEVVANWPHEVGVIVATDGERILGLGDLGAYGMGIPVGKLSLYTACAGIDPARSLPVMLDVGTDNDALLEDPLYTGIRRPRLRGKAYDELVEEFVTAVVDRWPDALLQFEDFATENAFRLLERYRDRLCTFNDDIQGTAAVTLAGIFGADRVRGTKIGEQTLLFLGAGAAATGIADLVVSAMAQRGTPEAEARERCWFMDSRGLVVDSRDDLAPHKRGFAHDHPFLDDLEEAVRAIEPTVLIGVSGQGGAFTEPVVRAMAELNERPVILALSNPTANSECTARQAIEWTDGRALFASGSPFDSVEHDGATHLVRQGNNAYVFPGVGLGALVSGARRVSDSMFHAAARTLAHAIGDDALEAGALYPRLTRIREVSAAIATAVARVAWDEGLARHDEPDDVGAAVEAAMWEPVYRPYTA